MFNLFSTSIFSALIIVLLTHAPIAFGAESVIYGDDTETMGYDAIVDQLTREEALADAASRAKNPVRPVGGESSLDAVMMHGGLGFATFIQSVQLPDGTSATLNQKGIQGAIGIDLFSPHWVAEGTVRSFSEDGDAKLRTAVQEFELKAYYKDRVSTRFGFRAGTGITGRYLTLKQLTGATQEYTTPMSVVSLGGDAFVSDRVSFGADINARNALIGETIDHGSIDMVLRVDAHF